MEKDIESIKKRTCEDCKHYREGLSADYVPGHYCNIGVTDKKNCKHFDDHITFWDWFEECWIGVVIVILLVMMNLLFS